MPEAIASESVLAVQYDTCNNYDLNAQAENFIRATLITIMITLLTYQNKYKVCHRENND